MSTTTMSCANAVNNWKQNSDEPASEATEVKLVGMLPPMGKMTKSLAVFENVEKLSLSTNAIEKIDNLNFVNLKVLSLGRNRIKRICGLD